MITPILITVTLLVASQSDELLKEMNQPSPSIENVEKLLKDGVEIDYKNSEGMTALAIGAMKNANASCLKLLLGNNANADCQDLDGNTPLMLSIKWNTSLEVPLTLRDASNLSLSNKKGDTAFHFVTKYSGDPKYYDLIFKANSAAGLAKDATTSPLHTFANSGEPFPDPSLIEYILGAGISIDLPDKRGKTAIALAIKKGNVALVKTLLKHEASTEKPDLIIEALDSKPIKTDLLETLLEKGVTLSDEARAIIEGKAQLKKKLLSEGLLPEPSRQVVSNKFYIPRNTPTAPLYMSDAELILPKEEERVLRNPGTGTKKNPILKNLEKGHESFENARTRLRKDISRWTVPMIESLGAYSGVFKNEGAAEISHIKASLGAWSASEYLTIYYQDITDKPGQSHYRDIREANASYEKEYKATFLDLPNRYPELKYRLARLYCPPRCGSCNGSGTRGEITIREIGIYLKGYCTYCGGSGSTSPGSIWSKACTGCDGEGWINREYPVYRETVKLPCYGCDGTGECKVCDGDSRLSAFRPECNSCKNLGFFTTESYGCSTCEKSSYYYWR
jgi:ankyrin repeat protein